MSTQTTEACQQVLTEMSRAGDMVLCSGKAKEIDIMLATIKENTICTCNDGQDSAKLIIGGYEKEAYHTVTLLGYQTNRLQQDYSLRGDKELIDTIRGAEIFVQRGQRYLERKQRYELAENSQN